VPDLPHANKSLELKLFKENRKFIQNQEWKQFSQKSRIAAIIPLPIARLRTGLGLYAEREEGDEGINLVKFF
jgi:hypothetical protein